MMRKPPLHDRMSRSASYHSASTEPCEAWPGPLALTIVTDFLCSAWRMTQNQRLSYQEHGIDNVIKQEVCRQASFLNSQSVTVNQSLMVYRSRKPYESEEGQ
ncbi:hypothetical protein BaRGS_00028316 [Batillaria attramentaria]|uniref:Uncharacterized protein n=1 Tax=Batillaria attramentaria TaxID=370345 RepID=A0ABD0JZC4_9CAEN